MGRCEHAQVFSGKTWFQSNCAAEIDASLAGEDFKSKPASSLRNTVAVPAILDQTSAAACRSSRSAAPETLQDDSGLHSQVDDDQHDGSQRPLHAPEARQGWPNTPPVDDRRRDYQKHRPDETEAEARCWLCRGGRLPRGTTANTVTLTKSWTK
jgi:hypothetical protein